MALLAALIIVGYSATNLFMSAYTASAEPYQQILAGIGTAAVVAWEAGAILLIGAAWHRGYRPIAVGASALLLVAMLVTLIWEARIVIGGRADKFASREVGISKLKGIEDDLAWLRKRRDSVTARKDLEWITERIDQRERDRDAAAALKEVMPEASTASQIMGGSVDRWRAFIVALPLLFWMLARVLAVPLAMMAFARKPKEASTAAQAPSGVIVPPTYPPALPDSPVVPVKTPEDLMPPKPKEGYPPRDVSLDPRFSPSKKNNMTASVESWAKECLQDCPAKPGNGLSPAMVKGSFAWTSYLAWADVRGHVPVASQSVFGKKLAKLGIRKENRVDGIWLRGYALKGEKKSAAVA